MTNSVVTKFNFKVEAADAVTFRARAAALGWTPGHLARVLVEEFNAGNFKLTMSVRDKNILKDIYK